MVAEMSCLRVKFVSKKISKVRWRPKSSSVFVTGSWDDEKNKISVWMCPKYANDSADDSCDLNEPYVICEADFPGSVTDIKVLSDELIIGSSSLGSICIFKQSEELNCIHEWEKAHKFRNKVASVTGISVRGHELASAGEDSRLCIFNYNERKKVREIESSDLCAFTALSYLRYQEVVLGNALGYVRIWDLRQPTDDPSRIFPVSRDQSGVTCMNLHPTQSHIVATGHDNGSICMWDMRQESRPTSILTGHSTVVTELLFHPFNPNYLYTCSIEGSVWQWDASKLSSFSGTYSTGSNHDQEHPNTARGNPWLNCDASKHRLEITALFSLNMTPVNSLDLSETTLLWGTDSEALYILPDIMV